jgi:hypothetical protein
MDNVDRMYRHLVRTIRSRFPQYLNEPFDVADLLQTILPYRLHRRELGLETNEDYDITLTELLAGARGYLIVDDRIRDALRADLEAANSDPSVFKRFPSASVALSPSGLRTLEAGPDDGAGSRRPSPPLTPPAPSSSTPPAKPAAASETPRTSPTIAAGSGVRSIVPQPGERCRSCNEVIPPGRALTFCPHCGQNLTTVNCPACGSELELGWKFCPTCGRPARNM